MLIICTLTHIPHPKIQEGLNRNMGYKQTGYIGYTVRSAF